MKCMDGKPETAARNGALLIVGLPSCHPNSYPDGLIQEHYPHLQGPRRRDTFRNRGSLHAVQTGLHHNQLSRSIPAWLGRLSRLTKMNLRSNQLSGSIPGSLGRLSRLHYLNLHSNDLSGDIPDLSTTMLQMFRNSYAGVKK